MSQSYVAKTDKLKGEEEINSVLKESGRRLNNITSNVTSMLEYDERATLEEVTFET